MISHDLRMISSDLRYQLIKAGWTHAWVYFCLVIVLGGFFVVNLFLAVSSRDLPQCHFISHDLPLASHAISPISGHLRRVQRRRRH